MFYNQIIATPASTLGEMSYATFFEMFKSCNSELEMLEEAQTRETDSKKMVTRAIIISKLNRAKENLTMHKHYEAYCESMDRRHYDAVYHRALV